jgi:predicted amino acid-binding ACT domain protein
MNICKGCFFDEELRSEINANAVIDGICEVCGKEGKVMDFSEFHGFFIALLESFSPTESSDKTIVDIIQDEWHLFKDKDIAKVSIVGAGMVDRPGIAADMFRALAEKEINIKMISTSEIKISCLVEKQNANEAIKALCKEFGLETNEIAEVKGDLPNV